MDRFGYNQPSLIKKNPVVIVKNFIVLQLTAVALFFLSAILLDYGEIYENLPLSTSFSFHIAEAIGIFLLETVLVFYIFFRWHKEYYYIKQGKIIYTRGILYRRKTIIPIAHIGLISYRQGPLGKLAKYGNIELEEGSGGNKFIMDHLTDPQFYVNFLVNLREGVKNLSETASSIDKILLEGEHESLEFKTSFRWDVRQNKVNKSLEKSVMKSIVAFLNSNGGQLLLGVDDSANIIGLANDYKSLPKQNADGFQNHFTNVFHSMIGPEFRQFVELNFIKKEGRECCLVRVAPSGKPAYLKIDDGEEFFIRTGNGTTSLRLSEAASYIDSRWKAGLL